MSSYHQTFFLTSGKSWEINFVPRVKTSPRSTFAITCTNLTANPNAGVANSFLYLINLSASSGSAISIESDLNQISNSIVLGSKVVSTTGITSHQYPTPIRVSDFSNAPCIFYILDSTFFAPLSDQIVSVSFLIEETFHE